MTGDGGRADSHGSNIVKGYGKAWAETFFRSESGAHSADEEEAEVDTSSAEPEDATVE